MSKLLWGLVPLFLVTMLAGCTNFKDSMATTSMDSRESERFKNMLVVDRQQLPENGYTQLGEASTEFNRPKHVTNYDLIKEDAQRSLKIKASRMGGNAITELACEKLENKGWQDELNVRCKADVLRIESREVLRDIRGEPVVFGKSVPAPTSNRTATDRGSPKQSFGVGWLSEYGVVVTTYHTIKNRENIFITLPTGEKLDARVLKQDPGNNIAILSPEKELPDRQGLPLAESKVKPTPGSEVFLLGFGASSKPKQDPRIVKGVLNSTSGFRGDPRTYRINASLEKGYSGSPLLSPGGRVLGMLVPKGSAPELFPGQKELAPDQHYAVKLAYLRTILEEESGSSSGEGEDNPISRLQENIFTVVAE